MLIETRQESTPMQILLVDDDVELCSMLATLLNAEGFAVSVAHDARTGLYEAVSSMYQMIVLDIMLPGGDGRQILKDIRAKSSVPVIMLTARGEAVDRISGLEAGADDYLAKPFDPGELVARIRAVLRRHSPPQIVDPLVVGDVRVEVSHRAVWKDGVSVELTSAEFELLVILLLRAGRCVSRSDLAQQALGRPVGPFDRSIDNHMSNLRRKLGPHGNGNERIRNIRSVGYCYTRASNA